ncbi:hypothetical protein QBC39DRAFT_156773 [Podospora conica]|nr:hypothetical protein QBC39DRAFT_156773 [Schizothecium conicum]
MFGGEQKCFTKQVHKGEEELCGIKFFARPQKSAARCGGDRPGRPLNDYDCGPNRGCPGPSCRGAVVGWFARIYTKYLALSHPTNTKHGHFHGRPMDRLLPRSFRRFIIIEMSLTGQAETTVLKAMMFISLTQPFGMCHPSLPSRTPHASDNSTTSVHLTPNQAILTHCQPRAVGLIAPEHHTAASIHSKLETSSYVSLHS